MKFVNYLSPEIKGKIRNLLNNIIRIVNFKKRIQTSYKYHIYKANKCHTFFGYYDVSPFNGENIIYLELPKSSDSVRIIKNNIKDTEKTYISESYAWNWQQGIRLRWFPNEKDTIIFNDFRENEYISRKINLIDHKEEIIPFPLYDISSDGQYGITLDFARLGKLRPGYGYTCKEYAEPSKQELLNEGIDIIDIKNKNIVKRITYQQIVELLNDVKNISNCYINHLSFSPSGNKFLFFWVEIINNYHKASLLIYDLQTCVLTPIETELKVSHYAWKSDNEILCTLYDEKGRCKYYFYSTDGKRVVVSPDVLKFDGHPSFLKENLFLTDTYPINSGYQYLFTFDTSNCEKKILMEIFSDSRMNGEKRTDLHPRVNENKTIICFDANTNGYRSFNLMYI